MKVNVKSYCGNLLSVESEGFDKKVFSFYDFFNVLKENIDNNTCIYGINFNKDSIVLYMLDELYVNNRAYEIKLDGSLLEDSTFMGQLKLFREYCEPKADKLYNNAVNRVDMHRNYDLTCYAKEIFDEYCISGEVLPIDSLEDAKMIVSGLRYHDPLFYVASSVGDKVCSVVDFENPLLKKIRRIEYASGVPFILSLGTLGFSLLVSMFANFDNASQARNLNSYVTANGVFSLVSGLVNRGADYFAQTYGKKEAIRIMDELADKIEKQYFKEIDEDSVLSLKKVK